MNIEGLGRDFSMWQAAACAACLPLGSALLAALDPKAGYSQSDFLLHRISDLIAREHIPYPWEKQGAEPVADFGTMGIDDFKRWHTEHFRGGCNG